MKLLVTYKDGKQRTLDLKPPLVYSHGTEMYTIQDSTGIDYWFNDDGTFDGVGMAARGMTMGEAMTVMAKLSKDGQDA